jgi:hypothetical protein
MKKCIKCTKTRNTNEFRNNRPQCKTCDYAAKKALPKLDNDVLVTEQKCSCCKIIKPAANFHPERTRVTGLYPYCRPCALKKQQEKYQRGKEKYKAKAASRYNKIKGTEAINAPARAYQKHKLATDPFFKVKRNLRNRLYYALKNKVWKKNTNFTKYIGCDRDTLITHLESQFVEGMSWENYANDTWHIDHIIPLDSAQTEEELHKLCHYTNLRPMFALDNIKKANKM